MASFAPDNRPNLPAPNDDNDPFVTNPSAPAHHRFSDFDHELFAAGPGSSPRQAKRALEAHLAETERRLDEAGKLGTALVSQRKALSEQLEEVEKLQAEAELNPDLRKKLVDIEKEYNDLARESARAFLPKQRVPSNEANPGSPFVPEGRSGRRSVSPSKFESQATGSPTKLSVPNRKIRNQPSNRNHDIEFAAEISQSLIVQVRNLQALLAERDEEVRDLKSDKSSLEVESEGLQQRLKALDESEHRYKEENWNLETRLQELSSQHKDAIDREKKLTHSLNLASSEKTAVQNKLDEVKLSHAKLLEEHNASVKQADIEMGTVKRNMIQAESERTIMQRKIDDLTNQNQELAKAFSQQRGRTAERDPASGQSEDDFETATDNVTPEHSPPPSPVKGTPRHSVLETETMKSSLHHAQRTIQSQRSLIHREKTEKLELRRMIQDLRDDLERARNEAGTSSANRRSRKVDSKEFKKNSRMLGGFRSSRQEVIPDDLEWEDNGDHSPRTSSANVSPTHFQNVDAGNPTDTTDQFETANEASESAFETANERGTETEDFQTVNEGFSGSDDAETETEETMSRGFGRMRPPPSLPAVPRHTSRESFDSTASTSADDDDNYLHEAKTPTASISSQRNRIRLSRGPFGRNARQTSEEPGLRSSPTTSFVSSNGDTPQAGQSLFAELGDFAGSDDESVGNGTPSRRSARSTTPGSTRRPYSPPPAIPEIPKLIMVDSGVMTDPVDFRDATLVPSFLRPGDEEPERPASMQSVVAPDSNRDSAFWLPVTSRPLSTVSYSNASAQYEPDMEAKLAQFPMPPSMTQPDPPSLMASGIQGESIEPREVPEAAPSLGFTPVVVENVNPVAEPKVPLPALSLSTVSAENLEPRVEPETPPQPLSWSHITSENLEPIAEAEIAPPALSISTIGAQNWEPREEPGVPPPSLTLSTIGIQGSSPILEPEIPPPTLSISNIGSEHLEPRQEAEIPPPALAVSAIGTQHWEPRAEREPPAPTLAMTSLQTEVVEPKEEAATPSPALILADIARQEVEPVAEPEPEPVPRAVAAVVPAAAPQPVIPESPQLSMSSLTAQNVEPIHEPEVVIPPPSLGISSVHSENLEPLAEPQPAPVPLAYSTVTREHVEPISEPIFRPDLMVSTIGAESVSPIAEPIIRPDLMVSSIGAESVSPVTEPVVRPDLIVSSIGAESVSPVKETPPALVYSRVAGEKVQPVSPVEPDTLPLFGFSSIASIETQPITPRSPRRDAFIMPRDRDEPETPRSKGIGSAYVLDNDADSSLVIAEDETRQSPRDILDKDTPESQRPFKEISNNAGGRNAPSKPAVITSDQGAQTSLTAETIDELFRSGSHHGHSKSFSVSSVGSPGTTGTVRIHRADDSRAVSPTPGKAKKLDWSLMDTPGDVSRPSTAASVKTSFRETPPLPPNHRELIEAARSGSSSGVQGSMPPPAWPASVLKNRPPTPSQRPTSGHSTRGTATPRAMRNARTQSPARLTARSRQSSVSSFVSEIDNRFNMRPGDLDPSTFGSTSDSRMIQAITQTMIGEYLWKYTRKTGRGEMSENRHRRYFWLHPYTRTLYWSDRDPSTAGRHELKAKSVPIEAVRVVTDDNPMPPGLHRKSLIVVAPGRSVKFTCTTGQRHETWFNALSYLLMRTNNEGQTDVEEVAHNITQEDVDEFNPQFGQRPANGNRPRAPASLSSYNSRTTRNHSPPPDMMTIPTLTPSGRNTPSQAQRGTLSKFFRTSSSKISGNFGSLRSRAASGQNQSIYEASEVHDSAEDLREIIEQQDRDADRLENVRACCDGKHDVRMLDHSSKRGRGSHTHAHPGPSTPSMPMASVRSRA